VIPEPWAFALLALAAFRVWKLIGDDAILDRPRDAAIDRLREWSPDRSTKIEYFITCPWCAGFWITLLWWCAWLAWPHGALVAATLFALSAVVGFLGVIIDALE
jgi:uncharacterized protein DUF1360